jgi:DNA invertase Pin-like site-specific DNA recombinase
MPWWESETISISLSHGFTFPFWQAFLKFSLSLLAERRGIMAIVGYARVSTSGQDLTAQLEQLQAVGVDRLFREKASGVKTDRLELAAMLDYVREGDIVVCCKLDRIARSTRHLLEIVDALDKKAVAFRVLNMNLDTSTPTGKLMLSMLAAIGQFEREMMLERQREGIDQAKREGVYVGRKPTARAKGRRVMSDN